MPDQNDRREFVELAQAIRRIDHMIEISDGLPRDTKEDMQQLIRAARMWEIGGGVVTEGAALVEQMIAEVKEAHPEFSDADEWTSKLSLLQRKLNQAQEMLRLFDQIKSESSS
jgi:hypothetical protein